MRWRKERTPCSPRVARSLGTIAGKPRRRRLAVGLRCELFLRRAVEWDEPGYETTGNVQLERLFGARLHFLARRRRWGGADARTRGRNSRGRWYRPDIVPLGGSNAVGALGYFRCGMELLRQADEQDIRIDHIVHASGSCGTQAGLVAAMLANNSGVRVTGISVSRSASSWSRWPPS